MLKLEINGQVHQGTREQLLELLNNLEDGIHYNSSTKGRIKISDMESNHIKNAILKEARSQTEEAKGMDITAFLNFLETPPSPTVLAMVAELQAREDIKRKENDKAEELLKRFKAKPISTYWQDSSRKW